MSEHPLDELVESLFTNGFGTKADRLVLMRDVDKRDLGGWCRGAVRDRISTAIRRELEDAADKCQRIAEKRQAAATMHLDKGERDKAVLATGSAAAAHAIAARLRARAAKWGEG